MGEQKAGKCDKCSTQFNYSLMHCGFGDCLYAYCDSCGKTAFFDDYKLPKDLRGSLQYSAVNYVIPERLESFIERCDCGGQFRHNASPRCPYCKEKLSSIEANKYIKSDSPEKSGWHWQNNWTGIYAIIIEGNKINDNWKLYPPKLTFKEHVKMGLEKTKNKPILLVPILISIGVVIATQFRLSPSFILNVILLSSILLICSLLVWVFVYSPFGRWLEKWFMKSYGDFIKSVEDAKKKQK